MKRLTYPKVYAPDHPVTPPGCRTVGAHRVILYDRIGPGPHPCHHCGRTVQWRPGAHVTEPDVLIADHLDRDVTNNAPDNLAPTCITCSLLNRSVTIRRDELWVMNGSSKTRADRRACATCGVAFLAYRRSTRRYCTRACSNRRHRITPSGSA